MQCSKVGTSQWKINSLTLNFQGQRLGEEQGVRINNNKIFMNILMLETHVDVTQLDNQNVCMCFKVSKSLSVDTRVLNVAQGGSRGCKGPNPALSIK